MICIKTFASESEAQRAQSELATIRISSTYDFSDFVDKWCVSVAEENGRAAYHHLVYVCGMGVNCGN